MINRVKYILLSCLCFIFCCNVFAQKSANNDFSFIDNNGIVIVVKNIDYVSKPLDTSFFKMNINALLFNKDTCGVESNCSYYLSITKIKKNEYDFRIEVFPNLYNEKAKGDIVKFIGGFSHYRIVIEKIKGKYKIANVFFIGYEC